MSDDHRFTTVRQPKVGDSKVDGSLFTEGDSCLGDDTVIHSFSSNLVYDQQFVSISTEGAEYDEDRSFEFYISEADAAALADHFAQLAGHQVPKCVADAYHKGYALGRDGEERAQESAKDGWSRRLQDIAWEMAGPKDL